MKKVCLTAMMLVLMVAGAYAQAQIGVKAGVNYATIGGDDTEDIKGRIAFHIGGMAAFGLTESVFIQPELLLSLQGARFEESETFMGQTITAEENTNLTYLNVPVMVKVFLSGGEGFNLQFGPQLGFLLAAKSVGEVSMGGDTEDWDEDIKEDLNSVDFGVGLGLGYETATGLSMNVRYNLGLSNLNTEGDDKNNNSVFQLSVGYFFNK